MNRSKGFTITELLVCIFAIAGLVLVGGFIYVAIHFLVKFW